MVSSVTTTYFLHKLRFDFSVSDCRTSSANGNHHRVAAKKVSKADRRRPATSVHGFVIRHSTERLRILNDVRQSERHRQIIVVTKCNALVLLCSFVKLFFTIAIVDIMVAGVAMANQFVGGGL